MNENLRKHWKAESLEIFEHCLKQAEAAEQYEACAKIKTNMDYLKGFSLPIDEFEYPEPCDLIVDEESIFIKFLPKHNLNSKIEEWLGKLEKKESKPKRKKK